MKINIKGCTPLEIPQNMYPIDSKPGMDLDTSYRDRFFWNYRHDATYRKYNLPAKVQCLLNIRQGLEFEGYCDVMAGLGISARIFSCPQMGLCEIDEDCLQILRHNFSVPTAIHKVDFFDNNIIHAYDFVFCDFNNFTMGKYDQFKAPLEGVFRNARKYVLINDCSVFYLNYGEKSFKNYSKKLKADIVTLEDYFLYLNTLMPDWSVRKVERFRETAFVLFEKGYKGTIEDRLHDASNINQGVITIEGL